MTGRITKMAPKIVELSCSKSFGGCQKVFKHESDVLKCSMNFSIYLPPQAEDQKCPVLFYLSGLTCTEKNFIQKAGAQRFASQYGFIVVGPDTSPRGDHIPGNNDRWNIGTGAGLYIDATQDPWKQNYRMYSYVTEELTAILLENFPILPDKQSIMGHSMGGHGAFLIAFRNPGRFKSASALAPVCNATNSKPFHEAMETYLGADQTEWMKWDSLELAKTYNGPPIPIYIDQGTKDEFLDDLHPKEFTEACAESRLPVVLNMRDGYDHSYYFVSTFIEDHFKHHATYLK